MANLKQYQRLLKEIQNHQFSPLYLLYGEEPYFIDNISEAIQNNALAESEKEFNQTILYGIETDPQTLINKAKQVPMMSERQVIIVKEAQKLRKYKSLLPYVKDPSGHTILVFLYKKKWCNLPKGMMKAFKQNGVVFQAKRVYENQLSPWITNYVKGQNYCIAPKAAVLLAEHLGTDLSKITNELDKLMLRLSEEETIDLEAIERNVGISRQYNIYEFQEALGERNINKANKIMRYFAANTKNHSVIFIVASLYKFFSNLYKYHALTNQASTKQIQKELGLPVPFFVKKYKRAASHYSPAAIEHIIDLLHAYDLRAKGINNVSTDQGELLRELTYKILH